MAGFGVFSGQGRHSAGVRLIPPSTLPNRLLGAAMRHALEMFDDLTRETQNGEGPRLQPEAFENFDQPRGGGFNGEKLGVSRFDVKTPNAFVRPSIASC